MIYVDKFAELIPFWESQGKAALGEFMKKRSDLLLQRLHSKDKQRAQSSVISKSYVSGKHPSRQGSAVFRGERSL